MKVIRQYQFSFADQPPITPYRSIHIYCRIQHIATMEYYIAKGKRRREERAAASSKKTNQTYQPKSSRLIDVKSEQVSPSNTSSSYDSDDELGVFVYKTSLTAQRLREEQKREEQEQASSTSNQITTRRKSSRLERIKFKEEEKKKSLQIVSNDSTPVSTSNETNTKRNSRSKQKAQEAVSAEVIRRKSSRLLNIKSEEVVSAKICLRKSPRLKDIKSKEDIETVICKPTIRSSRSKRKIPTAPTDDEMGGRRKSSRLEEVSAKKGEVCDSKPTSISGTKCISRTKRKVAAISADEVCSEVSNVRRVYRNGRSYKLCASPGCPNFSVQCGVCVTHGAPSKRRICSRKGCNKAAKTGGLCIRHGGTVKRYTCKHNGCNSHAMNGGVCVKHGAVVKRCSHKGCNNYAKKWGVCVKHGAPPKPKKICNHPRCNNWAIIGGVCISHGAKRKKNMCTFKGCTNWRINGGVCAKHGANIKKTCSHKECTKWVREWSEKKGFCTMHYRPSSLQASKLGYGG